MRFFDGIRNRGSHPSSSGALTRGEREERRKGKEKKKKRKGRVGEMRGFSAPSGSPARNARVRARAPGALILFLLRSSPSRDVNDLQLDISRRSLSLSLSSRRVGLSLRTRSRKRSAILAGNPRGAIVPPSSSSPARLPQLFPRRDSDGLRRSRDSDSPILASPRSTPWTSRING